MGLLIFIAVLVYLLIVVPVAIIFAVIAAMYKVAFTIAIIILIVTLLIDILSMIALFKSRVYGSKATGNLDKYGRMGAKFWAVNILGCMHLLSIFTLTVALIVTSILNALLHAVV